MYCFKMGRFFEMHLKLRLFVTVFSFIIAKKSFCVVVMLSSSVQCSLRRILSAAKIAHGLAYC